MDELRKGRELNGIYSREFMRIFWPHWVGAAVCIAFFAYHLAFVLPHRPSDPDPANGYTIELNLDPDAVYVSAMDLALLFGVLGLGMLIITSGLWRVRRAQKLSDPQRPASR